MLTGILQSETDSNVNTKIKKELEDKIKKLLDEIKNTVEDITMLTVKTYLGKNLVLKTIIFLDGDTDFTIFQADIKDTIIQQHNNMVASAMANRMRVVDLLVNVLGISKLAALL